MNKSEKKDASDAYEIFNTHVSKGQKRIHNCEPAVRRSGACGLWSGIGYDKPSVFFDNFDLFQATTQKGAGSSQGYGLR
jgi:hypothetical protein